jgi:hypothetical protein
MQSGLGVFPLIDRLRRAAYIERALIKHLSAWFLAAPSYEVKYRLGYSLWYHATHVQWLQDRLRMLRGGLAGPNLPPGLVAWIERVAEAPDESAFLDGYALVVDALSDFYEETLSACDASANAADVQLLRRIIPELRDQAAESRKLIGGSTPVIWRRNVAEALEAINGIGGSVMLPADRPAGGTPRTLPARIVFDERIRDLPLTPHDEKTRLPFDDAVREQFRVFFNEIYAASMLATILYDAFEHNLPWEFIHDFARHFWDECRHSEFGAVRLKELGSEPDRCDQTLFLNSLHMPLLHRVCYLTLVLEPYYMPRKKPRFEEYSEAGDERSQLFADHDWSDEINHVRLGKDWLERLLEDDARDVRQVKVETLAILENLQGSPVSTLSPF